MDGEEYYQKALAAKNEGNREEFYVNLWKAREYMYPIVETLIDNLPHNYFDGIDLTTYIEDMKQLPPKTGNMYTEIGILYRMNLYGIRYDATQSHEYFEKSALFNNKMANYMCGLNYYYGRGVQQNPIKSLEYFERAFELGFDKQYVAPRIASLYDVGIHIPDGPLNANGMQPIIQIQPAVTYDLKKAVKYYQIAIEHGDTLSEQRINNLDQVGYIRELLKTEEKNIDLLCKLEESKHNYEELEEKYKLLEEENSYLKAHIKYMPDGEGYYEAAASFKKASME